MPLQVRLLKMTSKGAKTSELEATFEACRCAYLKANPHVTLPSLEYPVVVFEPNGQAYSVTLDEAEKLITAQTDLHEVPGMCAKKTADGHVGNEVS